MNQEERVAQLEREIAKLKNDFEEYGRIAQDIGGSTRMFEAAVIALIASHPRPDLLASQLTDYLARVEAGIVHNSQAEEHLQGAQAAQTMLLDVLDDALQRFRNSLLSS
jgi:hypothetical protein